MVIGIAWKETEEFPYFKKLLENAQIKIKEFPVLHSILGDFSRANKENYKENQILMLASRAFSSPFLGGKPDLGDAKELKHLEILLKDIIPRLNRAKKEEIKSKLNEFNENNIKTIQELKLYGELRQNNYVSNLQYQNEKRGNHDFYFKLDWEEFNLELTSLGKSTVEVILEKAFNSATESILEEVPPYTYLKLDVQTDKLLDENGNNDPEEIKKDILKHYSSIKPIIHLKKGIYNIQDIPDEPSKSLFDAKETLQVFSHNYERILELFKTDDGIKFLKK